MGASKGDEITRRGAGRVEVIRIVMGDEFRVDVTFSLLEWILFPRLESYPSLTAS